MSDEQWSHSILAIGIELISGRHIQTSDCNAVGSGTPYLTGPEDFPNGRILPTKFVRKPDVVCESGDILLVVKGSGTGKSIRADRRYCISRQLMAIRSVCWSTDFLEHFLNAHEEYFNSAASGLIPGITREDILQTKILVPSLAQQRKIARILTTLDNLIEKTESLIAKYQAVKQGMMHDLFTRGVDAHGKLRPPQSDAPDLYKQSELGWIPKEWKVLPLCDAVESVIDGPFGSNLKSEHYVESPGVRVVRLQNIGVGTYNDSDRAFVDKVHATLLARHTVCRGDILVAALGEDAHPVGRACLYPDSLPPAINKADCFRVRSIPDCCTNAFLMHTLNGWQSRGQILTRMQGMTRTRINIQNIKLIQIYLPMVDEQIAIVRRIDSLEGLIRKEHARLSKLKVMKAGLMMDLLIGKVRVKVDGPAEATCHG